MLLGLGVFYEQDFDLLYAYRDWWTPFIEEKIKEMFRER